MIMHSAAEPSPAETDRAVVLESPARWKISTASAVGCCLTSMIPIAAAWFTINFVDSSARIPAETPYATTVDAMCLWDGGWYAEIVSSGYSYDRSRQSSVAFFPLYPLLARMAHGITGLEPKACLLVVSNLALATGCVLLSLYLQTRRSQAITPRCETVLLCLLLIPTSFFFRVAYSESLFFCLSAAVFLAIAARAPVSIVASLAGLTTATRLVGIAFLPAIAWYAWRRSPEFWKRAANLALVPLCLSGILAYAGWLAFRFGDPLAFVQTQKHWDIRPSPTGISAIIEHARLAPIVDVYSPECRHCYWATHAPKNNPLLNLSFVNPFAFIITLALIAVGTLKRWLTGCESVASLGLLLIPYFSQGYRICMASQARYALVVFPAMIVLAILLERLPRWSRVLCLGIAGVLLAVYAAHFCAGYWFV
jgi:hypothetical protein